MLFVGVLRDFNANGFYKIKLTDSSILYICVQKSEVYVYLKKEEATSQNWINKTIFFYEKKKQNVEVIMLFVVSMPAEIKMQIFCL